MVGCTNTKKEPTLEELTVTGCRYVLTNVEFGFAFCNLTIYWLLEISLFGVRASLKPPSLHLSQQGEKDQEICKEA